jgi:hypothetical protein
MTRPSIRQKKVTITLVTPQGYANAKMPVGNNITKTPVSGIGDEAIYGTSPHYATTLAVKRGDVYFIVQVWGFPIGESKELDEVQAKGKKLALQILSKL